MGLVRTPIVDKNGRVTAVHKRSGDPTVSSSRLGSLKPKLPSAASKAKPHQMDRVFHLRAPMGFETSDLGIMLNSQYPDKAIDTSRTLGDREFNATSREVYAVARHGISIRDSMALAHFGLTEAEDIRELVSKGFKEFDREPTPWIDALDENNIDIFAFHASISNGMSAMYFDTYEPQQVADAVQAYGYKALMETGIPDLILKGEVDWSDVKTVGVSRCSKNVWAIEAFLKRNSEPSRGRIQYPPLTPERLKAALIETEKRPRKSNFTWRRTHERAEDQVGVYARAYEIVGDHIDDLHMPELALALRKADRIEDGAKDLPLIMHVDEVIHQVRSDRSLSLEVGSHLGMDKTLGAVTDEYAAGAGAVEPVWDVAELADYYSRGLSVEETIESLRKGMKPAQAEGVYKENITPSISDGWL